MKRNERMILSHSYCLHSYQTRINWHDNTRARTPWRFERICLSGSRVSETRPTIHQSSYSYSSPPQNFNEFPTVIWIKFPKIGTDFRWPIYCELRKRVPNNHPGVYILYSYIELIFETTRESDERIHSVAKSLVWVGSYFLGEADENDHHHCAARASVV